MKLNLKKEKQLLWHIEKKKRGNERLDSEQESQRNRIVAEYTY